MKFALLTLIFNLFLSFAQAHPVMQVKGNRALIQIEGDPVKVGQLLTSFGSNGRKTAILKVAAIRGDKAIVAIIKGFPKVGENARPDKAAVSAVETQKRRFKEQSEDDDEDEDRPRTNLGFIVGMNMDSMAFTGVRGSATENLSMQGSSFAVKGFYDFRLNDRLKIRAYSGMDGFNTSGSVSAANQSICNNSTTCSLKYSYLSAEGHLLFQFPAGASKGWVGLGYVFYYAMSSSTNIFNLDTSVATNSMFALSAGMDLRVGPDHFLPFGFSYGYFPGAADVKASHISLFAGWGWRL